MSNVLMYGKVVRIKDMLDPYGKNPKNRLCLIVTKPDEIESSNTIDVVAVSTRFPDPLPEDHVLMPWHTQGRSPYGFDRKCAAVCTWQEEVDKSRILEVRGLLPGLYVAKVAQTLDLLKSKYGE